jgi:hypothetical protein
MWSTGNEYITDFFDNYFYKIVLKQLNSEKKSQLNHYFFFCFYFLRTANSQQLIFSLLHNFAGLSLQPRTIYNHEWLVDWLIASRCIVFVVVRHSLFSYNWGKYYTIQLIIYNWRRIGKWGRWGTLLLVRPSVTFFFFVCVCVL